MPILFIDYTNLVVKAYEEKRDANLLSQLLMYPTTVNLRQACLKAYNERVGRGEKVEENTLGAFFDVPPAGKKFDYVIEKHPADRFRPLQSLIRRETKNPNPVNVELLAWLVDFTPRPLSHAQKVLGPIIESEPVSYGISGIESKSEQGPAETNTPGIKEAPSDTNNVKPENSPEEEGDKALITGDENANAIAENNSERGAKKRKVKAASLIGLMMVLIFGGGYIVHQHLNSDCMYWAGDHYERVPCSEDPKGRIFLPLNEKKMSRFKRITRADTITQRSIGKVYYIKDSNVINYYTEGGNYPEDLKRRLKVLSPYIFDTYLNKAETSSKDSLTK